MPALLIGLGGCAGGPAWSPAPGAPNVVEVSAVPFYPQERYQCGPAALATVLTHAEHDVTPNELVADVYVPGRQGTFRQEIAAAVRARGLLAYPLAPSLDAVAAELALDRPVLVLQNLGVGWWPRWHYAVVVGLDATDNTVVLRSGTDERLISRARTFGRTWARSGHWGIVVLTPGELPASDEPSRYVQAASDLEGSDQPAAAALAYAAGLERWPDEALLRLGLANSRYALGDHDGAAAALESLLEREPDHVVALNNLATLRHAGGRRGDAERLIEQALKLNDQPALTPMLEATATDIRESRL